MTTLIKEYRVIKTQFGGRDSYTIKICLVDKETGEICGYDASTCIEGVSREHLFEILKGLPNKMLHTPTINEKKLKEHLKLDQPPQDILESYIASPVYTHKDVMSFKPRSEQEEVIVDLYHLCLAAIQDISRLYRAKKESLVPDIYDAVLEGVLDAVEELHPRE
jgi:hypothetical protein